MTNRMTESQVMTIAQASDLLTDFGYTVAAELLGRIADQELTLTYNPDLDADSIRTSPVMVPNQTIMDTVVALCNAEAGNKEYVRGLVDLAAEFAPAAKARG